MLPMVALAVVVVVLGLGHIGAIRWTTALLVVAVHGHEAPLPVEPGEPVDVWCSCGSHGTAVMVETLAVLDTPSEVVAFLCPDCREKRRPADVRDAAAAALRESVRAAQAKDRMHADALHADAMRRKAKVVAVSKAEAIERSRGTGRITTGVPADVYASLRPAFASCDHEWSQIHTHQSLTPGMELCSRCGTVRRHTITDALRDRHRAS
jgi:hypothetical protein